MQFSLIALFAAITGVVMASPLPLLEIRSCDAAKCAIALGPTGVGCLASVAEAGANPIADAGCVAGVLNSVVNAPAACAGCGSAAGAAISGAENAVSGAFGDVSSAIGSVF